MGNSTNDSGAENYRGKPQRISRRYLARNKMSSRNPGKSHRPGRITKNPFLNFLRDYRKNHCNMSVIQIACEGAKEWRSMSDEQKQQYMRGARVDNTKGKKKKTSKMVTHRSPKTSLSPRESKSPRRSMSKSA